MGLGENNENDATSTLSRLNDILGHYKATVSAIDRANQKEQLGNVYKAADNNTKNDTMYKVGQVLGFLATTAVIQGAVDKHLKKDMRKFSERLDSDHERLRKLGLINY